MAPLPERLRRIAPHTATAPYNQPPLAGSARPRNNADQWRERKCAGPRPSQGSRPSPPRGLAAVGWRRAGASTLRAQLRAPANDRGTCRSPPPPGCSSGLLAVSRTDAPVRQARVGRACARQRRPFPSVTSGLVPLRRGPAPGPPFPPVPRRLPEGRAVQPCPLGLRLPLGGRAPAPMEEPLALHPVKLYVYDLSKGMARRLSPLMLGKSTAGAAASRGLAFRH